MHNIQEKILELSKKKNLAKLSLRAIAKDSDGNEGDRTVRIGVNTDWDNKPTSTPTPTSTPSPILEL